MSWIWACGALSVVGLVLVLVVGQRLRTRAWLVVVTASLLFQIVLWGVGTLFHVDDEYSRLGFVDGGGVDGSLEQVRLWGCAVIASSGCHLLVQLQRWRRRRPAAE